MGSSMSAIADDMDYYQDICTMLGIEMRKDMYDHMHELEIAFGVRGKYDLIGTISKRQEQIKVEAFQEGAEAHDLKDMVKDRWVHFRSYDPRNQWFTYRLTSKVGGGQEYDFLVPIDDIGTGILYGEHKAIQFMRWIRKAIKDKTLMEVK
jgi:hypothetical protein